MGILAGFSSSIRGFRDEGSMRTDPNLEAKYGSGHPEQDRLTRAQLRIGRGSSRMGLRDIRSAVTQHRTRPGVCISIPLIWGSSPWEFP